MRPFRLAAALSILTAILLALAAGSAAQAGTIRIGEYQLWQAKLSKLRDQWVDRLRSRYGRTGGRRCD